MKAFILPAALVFVLWLAAGLSLLSYLDAQEAARPGQARSLVGLLAALALALLFRCGGSSGLRCRSGPRQT